VVVGIYPGYDIQESLILKVVPFNFDVAGNYVYEFIFCFVILCIHYSHNIRVYRAPSAGSSVARLPCNGSYRTAVASSNDPAATRHSAHPTV
jgi:hypothetical protein